MKSFNRIVIVIISMTVVGIAGSFRPYGDGSVYCGSQCARTDRINYRVDPNGNITDPCNNGPGGEYVLDATLNCVEVPNGTHFSSSPL